MGICSAFFPVYSPSDYYNSGLAKRILFYPAGIDIGIVRRAFVDYYEAHGIIKGLADFRSAAGVRADNLDVLQVHFSFYRHFGKYLSCAQKQGRVSYSLQERAADSCLEYSVFVAEVFSAQQGSL